MVIPGNRASLGSVRGHRVISTRTYGICIRIEVRRGTLSHYVQHPSVTLHIVLSKRSARLNSRWWSLHLPKNLVGVVLLSVLLARPGMNS